jgi:hypothetical protein
MMSIITDDHYKSKVEIKTRRIVIENHCSDVRIERKNNFMFIKIIMMC